MLYIYIYISGLCCIYIYRYIFQDYAVYIYIYRYEFQNYAVCVCINISGLCWPIRWSIPVSTLFRRDHFTIPDSVHEYGLRDYAQH